MATIIGNVHNISGYVPFFLIFLFVSIKQYNNSVYFSPVKFELYLFICIMINAEPWGGGGSSF